MTKKYDLHCHSTAFLAEQKSLREKRAVEIGHKLEKAGVPNAYEGAKALANGEVTRAHYARYLVQIGKVSNDGQAFKRYLGGGKSCFVKAEWVDIPTAIDTIHSAGGVAIIAHPMRYNMTGKWIRRLIVDFKQWGGDGMEVADSGQTKDQRQYLARLANEYDLAASLGSDFHFPCGWIELGKNLFLPEGFCLYSDKISTNSPEASASFTKKPGELLMPKPAFVISNNAIPLLETTLD